MPDSLYSSYSDADHFKSHIRLNRLMVRDAEVGMSMIQFDSRFRLCSDHLQTQELMADVHVYFTIDW